MLTSENHDYSVATLHYKLAREYDMSLVNIEAFSNLEMSNEKVPNLEVYTFGKKTVM